MSEKTNLLERLRLGDETALRQAYLDHHSAFLRWAAAISQESKTDLLDLYQETLIIFYQHLRSGKIQHLDNGVAPYLFGIGKKLILARHLRTRQEIFLDPADEVFLKQLELPAEEPANEEWRAVFKKAINQLSGQCQQIIEWFYYHDYSIDVICERLGYSSGEVTRVTKMRCLKKLRDLLVIEKTINPGTLRN